MQLQQQVQLILVVVVVVWVVVKEEEMVLMVVLELLFEVCHLQIFQTQQQVLQQNQMMEQLKF